jgi:serine/threonine protein kinase
MATLARYNQRTMNHRPPTLEPQLAPPDRPSAAAKFLYASGACPVDGFTIKRGIGRGGFGEVYYAVSDAGKEVALKLIRRNLDVELRGVRHCLNLKHNNLISLYDIRTDAQDDQWVVMEYVAGQSLEQAVEQHPNGMPVELVISWLRGIADGVAYLHDNGIVHRDLKPGNIFLDPSAGVGGGLLGGTVKIGDYGLSKFISCSRRSGQTESVGTVHYMAPEIANGRYGREIDTYALGVMLYEMLTGHVPFEGESIGEVLMKHLTAEPDLSKLAQPFRTIVARCLAKDPAVRIQSVYELVELLPTEAGKTPSAKPRAKDRAEHAAWPEENFGTPVLVSLGASQTQAEEPIWQAIKTAYHGTLDNWRDWDATPVAKSFALLGLACAAILSSGVWIPTIVTFACFYAVYYLVWTIFLRPTLPATAPALVTTPLTRTERREERKRRRYGWRDVAKQELLAKSARTRVTELLRSMLIAAAACIAVGGVASQAFVRGADGVPLWMWFATVGTLGSWSVLVVNKVTEARVEDHIPMRLMQLALGAAVGYAAWGLGNELMLGVPHSTEIGPQAHEVVAHEIFSLNAEDSIEGGPAIIGNLPNGSIRPSMRASAVYFALLLLVARWWRLADYTRSHRLSLWSVVVSIGFAFGAGVLWWYPQPTGMVVAGMIAVATQLASPWLASSRRVEMAKNAPFTV